MRVRASVRAACNCNAVTMNGRLMGASAADLATESCFCRAAADSNNSTRLRHLLPVASRSKIPILSIPKCSSSYSI